MTIELWTAFVLASIVLLAIPGPTILTVVSYSLTGGTRARLPLIAAVALGDTTALALSLVGLGAVLATSAWAFTIVKWAGGLYLIFLGVRLIHASTKASGSSLIEQATETRDSSTNARFTWFANTWLVTALNPKGIIFFIAFLPQFIDTGSAVAPQLWLLSATFVFLAVMNASLYVLFASKVQSMLASPQAQQRFNLGGGCLLTAAGGWALTAKQAV